LTIEQHIVDKSTTARISRIHSLKHVKNRSYGIWLFRSD